MMALKYLDPRNGGACSNCLANKTLSYVVGYIQLVLWICGFVLVMFDPSSMVQYVEINKTAIIIIAVIIFLISLTFTVLLLVGLYKERPFFIKSYCIYAGTYVVLLVLAFVVNIFAHPQRYGFGGFFSTVISIAIYAFFFLVVRSYYLLTYCNGGAHDANIAPTLSK